VSQGAGVHLDAGKLVVRVSDVGALELREACLHIVEVEEAFVAEHGVVGLHGMSLGEDEAVTVGVIHRLRRDPQMVLVEDHEGIDHGHVASDMSAASCHDDVDGILAQVPAQALELVDFHSYSPLR
jgi:hypothetical protein